MIYTLVVLALAAAALPLTADENLKPPAAATSTQSSAFSPGGTLKVDGSYGDLYVEGWDQPRVEVLVDKFMPYEHDPAQRDRAARELESVGVDLDRKSATEMELKTEVPPRKGLLKRLAMMNRNEVRLEYHIHVPHDTKLVIHHDVGMVSVSDVSSDIEATCHRGDILLWLQDTGMYSIDARNKLGKVSSDFPGTPMARFLVGQRFMSSSGGRKLYLRMGFGGITLKPMQPESGSPTVMGGAK